MSGEMPLAWIERPDGVKYRATAAIAALAHHDEQTARRQFRELLQRRADERQIRLDLRSPRWGAAAAGMAAASVAAKNVRRFMSLSRFIIRESSGRR